MIKRSDLRVILSMLIIVLFTVSAAVSGTIKVPADYSAIQDAIAAAVDFDTVEVSSGIYTENIDFLGKEIVLVSEGGADQTSLYPAVPDLSTILLSSETDKYPEINGFTIVGGGVAITVLITGMSPIIKNCVFHDNIPIGSSNIEVISCTNSSALITRNLFYNNGGIGCIGLREGSTGARIINNTMDSNERGFFSIAGGGIAINNIVTNSIERGVGSLAPGDFTILDYNNIWNNNPNYNISGVGDPNEISIDPLYLDPVNQNYYLNYFSPCINAGDPDPQYNDPDGTRNDMGAFPSINESPSVLYIKFLPENYNGYVTSSTPQIEWFFYDSTGASQNQYEIEVGTDDDWAVAEMWSTGSVYTADTNTIYAGTALEDFSDYYLRIRVNNGTEWSNWKNVNFFTKFSSIINIPDDFTTIQEGLDHAESNDIIMVAAGTYYENLDFNGKEIVLASEEGKGLTFLIPEIPDLYTIRMVSETNYQPEIYGFTISGGGTTHTILINGMSPFIHDNVFHDNIPIGTNNNEVISCSFSSALITRNLFYNNGGIGCVGLRGGSTGAKIINNTMDHNERGFFSISGGGTAINNIVTNSLERGVGSLAPGDFTILDYNNIWNNNPDYDISGVEGLNDISLDPLYVDPENFDYNLDIVSPCINAGHPDVQYYDPDSTRNDMGAFPGISESPSLFNIELSPVNLAGYVTSLTPQIDWVYYDSTGTPQVQYEIEVGTDDDWAFAEMWDTEPFYSGDNNAVYDGLPLESLTSYYLRVRVNNGTDWSSWKQYSFITKLSSVIYVPGDVATIQEGLDVADIGDSVIVAPGTYIENINFNGVEVNLIGQEGSEVTFLEPANYNYHTVYMATNAGSQAEFSGFTIRGGGPVHTILIDGGSPTIKNNIFYDNIPVGSQDVEVISCVMTSALITQNLFYNNGGIGCVGLRNLSLGTRIINNTMDGNERGFFSIAGGGIAINNIVTNSIERGIGSLVPGDFTILDYNNIWNNNPNYDIGGIGGPNDISYDPLYVDPMAFDYHLSENSPCIDAGNPDPQYSDPDASKNDIGAFPRSCCVMRGDIIYPYDGQILVDDLVFLVDYLFNGGAAPYCTVHGDLKPPLDGNIFVEDLVYLVDYLFSEAWIPPCF